MTEAVQYMKIPICKCTYLMFSPSPLQAFQIITSNVLRVAAINSVGDFVLFLGKIGVTAATCAISVLWLRVSLLQHTSFILILVIQQCHFNFLRYMILLVRPFLLFSYLGYMCRM